MKNLKTKIIITLGPSTDNKDMLDKTLKNGVDIIRVNFSHGTFAENSKRISEVKEWNKLNNKSIKVMADLPGPKMRIKSFAEGRATLVQNNIFTLDISLKEFEGNNDHVGLSIGNIFNLINPNLIILLSDGRIRLKVLRKEGSKIICRILCGGTLGNKQGINIPNLTKHLKSMSESDIDDISNAIILGVDFIAISFVNNEDDIINVRKILSKNKSSINIIAKIETLSSIENLESIIIQADMVMIARGDLGIEYGLAKLPPLQKKIIKKCIKLNTPVIIATHMLYSMINSITPTRAEVSDIANAIIDGANAILLTNETTISDNPDIVVKFANDICKETENYIQKL